MTNGHYQWPIAIFVIWLFDFKELFLTVVFDTKILLSTGTAAQFSILSWLKLTLGTIGRFLRNFYLFPCFHSSSSWMYKYILCLIFHSVMFSIRRKASLRDQVVMTPSLSWVGMETRQLTEENADFASRHRHHQSSYIEVMRLVQLRWMTCI